MDSQYKSSEFGSSLSWKMSLFHWKQCQSWKSGRLSFIVFYFPLCVLLIYLCKLLLVEHVQSVSVHWLLCGMRVLPALLLSMQCYLHILHERVHLQAVPFLLLFVYFFICFFSWTAYLWQKFGRLLGETKNVIMRILKRVSSKQMRLKSRINQIITLVNNEIMLLD